ncbi:MAG TPA: class IV adenylate cyclase [Bryobacteraceae bacterium]|nr:class IV adenylate cyclase [Bryobacteraceae bacterium]
MPHGNHETEIKLAVEHAGAGRRVLRAAGFRVSRKRVFESNIVFDNQAGALRQGGLLLRVRQAGRVRSVTYKGPTTGSKHKSREELEIGITDARIMALIFERLGFHPAFRYDKYRTEFRPLGSGLAVLDETPIGVFLELEGSDSWIDRMARKLNFSEQDYITKSYAALYLDWCREKGITPGDMVFQKP